MNTHGLIKQRLGRLGAVAAVGLAALAIPASASASGAKIDGVRAAINHGTLNVTGGDRADDVALRLKAGDSSRVQVSGGSDLLLFAIAGPVIAGTSLFGGRGFIWSAFLGALVIQSISNGMDLLALESDIKFMITGAVLLLAVTIDAVTRRRREASGAA